MSALVVLAMVGLWAMLGYLIWRLTFSRVLRRGMVRLSLGTAFAWTWLLAPWADEWLGAREFRRLCEEMPEVKFFGPVAMGPGPFFDEQGQRKLWTQREIESGKSPFAGADIKGAHSRGQDFEAAWRREFERKTTRHRVREWPTPVLEEVNRYFHISSGKLVRESHWLGSPGGWIKRTSGWGNHAPYSCSKERDALSHEAWITY